MKWALIVIGIVLLAMGIVWALQGTNVLAYGQMAGVPRWIYLGAALGVIGIVLIVLGARIRKKKAA
jgi:hypothetical protein